MMWLLSGLAALITNPVVLICALVVVAAIIVSARKD